MTPFEISRRLIFSKKRFSFTNISIILSIVTLMIATLSSILALSLSRGYENAIYSEISKIEPDKTLAKNNFKATEGCVALKKNDLKRIVKKLNKNIKVIIT